MEWNGVVDGLIEAATQAQHTLYWKPVVTLLEAAMPYNSVEFKQLMKIKEDDKLFETNIIRETCDRGYTELMQVFLNSGLSPNYIPYKATGTLLLSAAYAGNLCMVKQLLNAGADVNCKCLTETPILMAARNGHLDVMKHLISAGADINVRCCDGDTVCDVVLKYKSCDIEEIVQHLIEPENIRNEKNAFFVLCLALASDNVKIVKKLLDAGFYVNGTADFKPLHTAAQWGNIPIMQFLLKYGADINSTNSKGNSALHEVFTYFKDISQSSKILKKVEFVIKHDIFKNKSPSPNILESVKFLIEHGILLDSVNNYQESPLLMSIDVKAFDEAMLLINSGADVNLDVHHELLHKAIRADAPVELIECLLEHGANVTTTCDDKTALQYVIYHHYPNSYHRKPQLVKLLLVYGSDHYYVENRCGDTLLHLACKMIDVELVQYLIDYGLDVDAKNREAKKPIDIAHSSGEVAIENIIIEYHCNKYTI